MKCTECPFTLLCYTGFLHSIRRCNIMYLCPTCEKLIYFYRPRTGPYILYRFSCELRPVTNAMEERWKNYNNLICVGHTCYNSPVWDHTYKLLIRECAPCRNTLAPHITLKDL